MRDKIIEDYKILLALGWMYDVGDGLVSARYGDELMPATVNGKRIVLPTQAQMKNTNWDNLIGFHPVRESYNLGVSDMLASLRDQYEQRFHATIAHFMKQLLTVANDQKNQKNLTTEQSQVLNALPKITKNTLESFNTLLKQTNSRGDTSPFIRFVIRRGGTVGGRVYGRAGLVKFPIYEELIASKDAPINGVTLTAKDRLMMIELFEFIFPTLKGNPEAFCVGVDSRSAPFMESLVRSTIKVAKQLEKSAAPYLDIIMLPELLTFPKDMDYWLDVFDSKDKVERLAETIPNLSEFDNANPSAEKESEKPVEREREVRAVERPREETRVEEEKPRGRMIMGAPGPADSFMGKTAPGQKDNSSTSVQSTNTGRVTARAGDADREAAIAADKRRREEEDRERRERDRREEEDRKLDRERRERREREDDERDRRRREEDRYERDRPRSGTRDRDDDRDRGRGGKSGDIFEDNPVLRNSMRDIDDRDRDDRRYRGRNDRYRDPRDQRGGRGRDRDSRYDRDDRYDDRYDDRDDRYRGRR